MLNGGLPGTRVAGVPPPPPPVLPGFEGINRYWDRSRGVHAAKILPGEYYVTTHDEMIATVLGSCISACIRDRDTGIGGMNHFMLPEMGAGGADRWGGTDVSLATRYGSYAMEHMINDILKHGGRRSALEVKVFGGGQIIRNMSDVGKRNIEFVRRYLQLEGLTVVGEDLGDIYPRKVVYFPRTGRALVKKLRTLHNDTIIQREQRLMEDISHTPVAGEIELF